MGESEREKKKKKKTVFSRFHEGFDQLGLEDLCLFDSNWPILL